MVSALGRQYRLSFASLTSCTALPTPLPTRSPHPVGSALWHLSCEFSSLPTLPTQLAIGRAYMMRTAGRGAVEGEGRLGLSVQTCLTER